MSSALNEPSEYISSEDPFIVRRLAKWNDCDPAGVVWTGRFFEYAGSALRLYLKYLVHKSGFDYGLVAGDKTPIKAYSFVFHRSLWPEEMFDMTVSVVAVRTSTFECAVAASIESVPVFNATITNICIAHGVRKRVPVPDALRTALSAGFGPP